MVVWRLKKDVGVTVSQLNIGERKTLNRWLNAVVDTADDIAKRYLDLKGVDEVSRRYDAPIASTQSLLALVGDSSSVQIGIGAPQDEFLDVVRALIGAEPDDDDLSSADIADALGEMANMLAGGVKVRMAKEDPSIRISLPLVIVGGIVQGTRINIAVAEVEMGECLVSLMVIKAK